MSEPLLTAEMSRLVDEIDTLWREVRKATSGPMATFEGLSRAQAALTQLFGIKAEAAGQLRAMVGERLNNEFVSLAARELRRRYGLEEPLDRAMERAARVAQVQGQSLEDFVSDIAGRFGLEELAA